MENLHANLITTHRKRACDAVWAASDAAQYVLAEFQRAARAGTLEAAAGPEPFYVFDPNGLAAPAGANFTPGQWEKYHGHVLAVLRESTGLQIKWAGPGARIELHLTGPCARVAAASCTRAQSSAPEAAPQPPAAQPAQPLAAAAPVKGESPRPDNLAAGDAACPKDAT